MRVTEILKCTMFENFFSFVNRSLVLGELRSDRHEATPKDGNKQETFITYLPPELRDRILSELLSVERNITVEEVEGNVAKLGFSLPDIKILTINQQIFRESMQCINRENIFISLSCNNCRTDFLEFASAFIPLGFKDKNQQQPLPPRLFHVRITHSLQTWLDGNYWKIQEQSEDTIALMHSRHLPTFIQLINCYQSSLRFSREINWEKTKGFPLSHLTVRFMNGAMKTAIDLAFASLKELRNASDISHKPFPTQYKFAQQINLQLQGLDSGARGKLMTAIQLPPPGTTKDALRKCFDSSHKPILFSKRGFLSKHAPSICSQDSW